MAKQENHLTFLSHDEVLHTDGGATKHVIAYLLGGVVGLAILGAYEAGYDAGCGCS